ncbi:MAG: tyrosine recombinase XerC [Dehalococcoidia bacterium]|nr:tyrosine recombinase XerC [Dehalococcoidia bacterium]
MSNNFNGYLDRYLIYLEAERHASRYTVRNYKSDIRGNIGDNEKGFLQFLTQHGVASLEAVDKRLLRDYLSHLIDQGVAKVSLSRKLSAIRSFYRYLLREELISRNPIEEASSPKLDKHLPSFLSADEMDRLLSCPDSSTPHGLRDRAVMELIYAAGLRVSEAAGLDKLSADLDGRTLRVLGKGNRERVVIMGYPAVQALSTYLNIIRPLFEKTKTEPALFLNYQGKRLSPRWIQKLVLKYAAAAGLEKKVHPHLLRHTFATHLLDGGADLRVVQELLGHANLATTQIYTHVTQAQARKVYLASHPMAQAEAGDEHS